MDEIIISDSSTIIALYDLGKLDLLQKLYKTVTVTPQVSTEVLISLPEWFKTKYLKDDVKFAELREKLDIGEASAIALSLENKNSKLIIDETKGRNIAQSLNIPIIGTVGILILAYKKEMIDDLEKNLFQLKENGFYISDKVIAKALFESRQRKN